MGNSEKGLEMLKLAVLEGRIHSDVFESLAAIEELGLEGLERRDLELIAAKASDLCSALSRLTQPGVDLASNVEDPPHQRVAR